MIISKRFLHNPKYKHVQVTGTLLQLSLGNNKAFLVNSEKLALQYIDHSVTIHLENQHIKTVNIQINGEMSSFSNIKTINDCFTVVKAIRFNLYWQDESAKLFIFLVLRILVATALHSQQLADKNITISDNWGFIQYEISRLLLGCFEKENIKSSPFVPTTRAEHLLIIGLNPDEKYEHQEIKNICKSFLKILHPDILPGAEEVFIIVNAAQRYLRC